MTRTAAATASKLYSPRLLMLSTGLSQFPLDDRFEWLGRARSKTCGSVIALGLDTDEAGTVSRVGMQVTACAVGQSSAAVLAKGVIGSDVDQLTEMKAHIENWLEGEAPLPQWPEFDALEPAREHRGRHGAILLPWTAAIEALSSRAATS